MSHHIPVAMGLAGRVKEASFQDGINVTEIRGYKRGGQLPRAKIIRQLKKVNLCWRPGGAKSDAKQNEVFKRIKNLNDWRSLESSVVGGKT